MYQYTIELYKNHSENNELIKNLTDKRVINGTSRSTVDLLNPVITLSTINVNEFNYCYIKELKRYYYIVKTIIQPKGISIISLNVDVLMTYSEDIKASKGLITKQKNYNPYYGEFDVESKTMLQKYEFENVFDDKGEFVLVALRG